MVEIYFKKSDSISSVSVNEGQTLLDAAKKLNISEITADCKGNCACGTCHVYIDANWIDKIEPIWSASLETYLLEKSKHYNEKLSRLACQIDIKNEYNGLIVNLIKEI
jgi:2Fe-2S ferredoxin